ncbi:MAG: ATP-binding protein [Clostridia bacterium]|nr:ATP-binding protein [Clostridia bacterium]
MSWFKRLFGGSVNSNAQPKLDVSITAPETEEVRASYTVRIAAYDSLSALPRTIDLDSDDFPEFVELVSSKVYSLCREKGGLIPFVVLREAVENLIHASFADAVITVMPDGNVVRISDHGPGIPDKERAFLPGFTTASGSMKRRIKGVGSGLPIVRESLESSGGSVTIEDNLGHGSVVTLSAICNHPTPVRSGLDHHDQRASQRLEPGGAHRPIAQMPAHSAPEETADFAIPGRTGAEQSEVRLSGTEQAGSSPSAQRHPCQQVETRSKPALTSTSQQHYQLDVGDLAATSPEGAPPRRDGPPASLSKGAGASPCSDLDNISPDGTAATGLLKQDSASAQSNKRQDESSAPSNDTLDSLLSARQKKVFLLIAEMGEIGPSTVTKELEISLSTAYRDLVTLEELGLVEGLDGGKRRLTKRGIDFLGYIFK